MVNQVAVCCKNILNEILFFTYLTVGSTHGITDNVTISDTAVTSTDTTESTTGTTGTTGTKGTTAKEDSQLEGSANSHAMTLEGFCALATLLWSMAYKHVVL